MIETHPVPSLNEALASPADYTLTLSALGWTLQLVDDETYSVLVTQAEAERFIEAMSRL